MKHINKPPVFVYGNFVLVRRADKYVDVCDPRTKTWSTFKTERHAKWSATVFSNLCNKFGHQLASDVTVDTTVRYIARQHVAGATP